MINHQNQGKYQLNTISVMDGVPHTNNSMLQPYDIPHFI